MPRRGSPAPARAPAAPARAPAPPPPAPAPAPGWLVNVIFSLNLVRVCSYDCKHVV